MTSNARLSGVLATQVVVYFRLYRKDAARLKTLVSANLRGRESGTHFQFRSSSSGVLQFSAYSRCFVTTTLPLHRILDFVHSFFVCAAVWYYLVSHFSDWDRVTYAPWTVPVRSLVTLIA